MKKICILTSGHPPFDERIYWKFAFSFKQNGLLTSIICSTHNIDKEENGIILKGFCDENISKSQKINKLIGLLAQFSPDFIICCEPLTIMAAAKYKRKQKVVTQIISDVTEWYPENVALKLKGIKRYFTYGVLFLFNLYTANLADAIIIGEKRKKKRYDLIAPFKKKAIIGYYPVLKYFNYSEPALQKEIVLCYAGLIKKDRGVIQLLKAAEEIAVRHPEKNIKVKLIGKFETPAEENEIKEIAKKANNIRTEFAGWTTYPGISDKLKDVHICFDLRTRNFIYKNSLPIKIFEYMACGKPFIFADIVPIRDEMDYNKYGHLVDPDNLNMVVNAVEEYLINENLFRSHSVMGRRIIEESKNWEKESEKLISFINGL